MTAALYATTTSTTPIAIPQPLETIVERVPRGTFADGSQRFALGRRVTWRFRPLTEAQFALFLTTRPANGRVKFRTWWPAEGSTAGGYRDCTGIMALDTPARVQGGRYRNAEIVFTEVVRL